MAKGYAQWSGIDHKDTFVPTTRMATIRIGLVIAKEKWLVFQMDVTSAFINRDLREVYFE